jgi:hypothetical protein
MLIYAMSVPAYFKQGIYKIGEADSHKQLHQRRKTFQTYYPETVQVYALWDIGDIPRKADNRLHTIFKEYKYGHGGTEFFKGVSLDKLHEGTILLFGPSVERLV